MIGEFYKIPRFNSYGCLIMPRQAGAAEQDGMTTDTWIMWSR